MANAPKLTTPDAGALGAGSATTRATRALLACGVVAGPLFVVVGLLQASSRDGFDLSRHQLSLLSLGELGWIQTTNFVVSGLLFLTGAAGMWRVLRPGRGGTWGPLLVGGYGVGLLAAGVFAADPAFGFPPGTPEGAPDHLSWHGALHFTLSSLGFLSLIVGCFVLARRFAAHGRRGWAAYSLTTAVAFLAATAAIAARPNQGSVNVLFFVVAIFALGWVSVIAGWLTTGAEG
jgi:Protein of unknown function (DUF998)